MMLRHGNMTEYIMAKWALTEGAGMCQAMIFICRRQGKGDTLPC